MRPLRKEIHEFELDPIENSGEQVEDSMQNSIGVSIGLCVTLGFVLAVGLVVAGFYVFGSR